MLYALLIILPFVLGYTIIVVWVERKVSAFMQDRLGPMETGPKGLLQTIADVLKLLQKELIVPTAADKWVFLLAPLIIFVAIFAGFAMIPVAPEVIGSSANVGVYYLLGIISIDVLGMLLAGWSSNNKFSLMGAIRAISQAISYEIPVTFCVLAVVMISQSMSLQEITLQQGVFSKETNYLFGISALGIDVTEVGGIVTWNIVRCPILIVGLIVFYVATLAEANRAPFDLPVAESELIAGFQTEYSGFRWSLIMLGEYAMMLLVAMLGVILFLGGWNTVLPNIGSAKLATWTSGTPGEWSSILWGAFWLISKSLFWVMMQIWTRWVFPRLRVDQLMHLCWKVFVPVTLLLVFVAGVWRLLMI